MYPDDCVENWNHGQGLWSHIDPQDWNRWHWQMNNRISNLNKLQELITLSKEEEEGCRLTNKKLSLGITPHYFNLIDLSNPNCPIRK